MRQIVFNYFAIFHLLLKRVSKCHMIALCLTVKIEDDEDSYVLYYMTARYKLITRIALLTTNKYILLD
jgi:hypothetical protein